MGNRNGQGLGHPGVPTSSHEGGATLGQVAEHFGISKQRVQQIEKAALEKLRKTAERRGIDLQGFLREIRR